MSEPGFQRGRRRRRRGFSERLIRALLPYMILALAVFVSLGVVRIVELGSTTPAQGGTSFYASEIDFSSDFQFREPEFYWDGERLRQADPWETGYRKLDQAQTDPAAESPQCKVSPEGSEVAQDGR